MTDTSTKPVARYHDLEGKSVYISGGATGIGHDIVKSFHAQGAIVNFVDLNQEAGEELASELGERIHFTKADITDPDQLTASLVAAESRGGGLDVLVNNAANDQRHDFFEATPEFFDQTVAVNLKHQYFAAQTAARFMKERKHGSIIHFGSVAPRIPSDDLHIYIACKEGVRGLTRSMAKTLGEFNIRVNAITPGAILTEKQLKLWIDPELEAKILADQFLHRRLNGQDIAEMALFLASDASSACTGHLFVVDGGLCY